MISREEINARIKVIEGEIQHYIDTHDLNIYECLELDKMIGKRKSLIDVRDMFFPLPDDTSRRLEEEKKSSSIY